MKEEDMTKPEVNAAESVDPREARKALRAAGYKAPYSAKDVAKITAIIRKLAAQHG
jgi:hypothetical protein